jgi:Zn-dependent metalloprotease/PKD repeat protein
LKEHYQIGLVANLIIFFRIVRTKDVLAYTMRKTFLLLAALLACSIQLFAQEFKGAEAAQIIPGAKHVWLEEGHLLPKFVRFEDNQGPERIAVGDYITEQFGLVAGVDSWFLLKTDIDKLGHRHDRYQQYYNGYPVEGSMIIVHSENDQVYSINGAYFSMNQLLASQPSLSEEDALKGALAEVDAELYKWEIPGEEGYLQRMHEEDPQTWPRDTYLPEGELVIVPAGGDFEQGDFRLAWKFDVYAQVPLQRVDIFIDAVTGEPLTAFNKIHTADTPGTVDTRYSGTRNIIADSFGSQYRLRERGRGNGVYTWNMQNGTNHGAAVDFVDNDNDWDFAGGSPLNNAAGDAHWGSEMTYDYYNLVHGINSIDNNGFPLNSYINYGQNFTNAFWDGQRMTYGDGGNRPFSTLDIAGHEVTHGLTNFTANLIYQDESGALNESFSDIFGKAIEFYARPGVFTWNIGQDIGAFRDMSNPLRFNSPRNYKGNRWWTARGDNGGVHFNSGVQNHWFYLLVEGGQGTNDFGDAYNVPAIGWDTASAIAFRNLTVYLGPSSQYEDARFFAIESAIDLYGSCTRVHAATVDAWAAVGIGDPFSFDPVSDFNSFASELCSAPYEVEFLEQTQTASTFEWNFGDGTTSTQLNPTHTYARPGQYSVSLKITGLCGGEDSLTKTNYITISQAPAAPSANTSVSVNCKSGTTLSASGNHFIQWYNANDELVGFGNSFQTPELSETTTFYARDVESNTFGLVGPPNGSFGNGSFHNDFTEAYLEFEVYKECLIASVTVLANDPGQRTIFLYDNLGNPLASQTVDITTAGQQLVDLNFSVRPGRYRLGGRFLNLYRQVTGANYPYTINDLISITGSSEDEDHYFYFYNWEVFAQCASEATAITVTVDALDAPDVSDVTRCGNGPVTLKASHPDPNARINWYDDNGTLVFIGNTFTTAPISTTQNYEVQAEIGTPTVFLPPAQPQAVGGGGYFDDFRERGLFFDVIKPLVVKSVLTDAGSSGRRDIVLRDDRNMIIRNIPMNIPRGQRRIRLDLQLEPGRYFIGGANMDLFRNNNNAMFPYEYQDLLSIVGTNAGRSDFYYFFYDWEVQEVPCLSPIVPVSATVQSGNGPTSQFSYSVAGGDVQFTNQSGASATSYSWDFGDGNRSTSASPRHRYGAPGIYTVTLVASDGVCSETSSQQVEVISVSVDPGRAISLKVYPNPGNGNVVIAATFETAQAVDLEVYDAMGRSVFGKATEPQLNYREQLNLGHLPSGTYFIRLQADGQQWIRKYLKE